MNGEAKQKQGGNKAEGTDTVRHGERKSRRRSESTEINEWRVGLKTEMRRWWGRMWRWIEMGEYPRSRESYYNPNTQNTKMLFSLWALHYGTMHYERTGRPANSGAHTQTHSSCAHLHTNTHTHTHTHSKTHVRTHNYLKSFQQHDDCNLHTRRTKCINTSTTENNIVGEIIQKVMCSHKQKQYSLSENRHWWEEVCVWQRDRGRHTVRWVRSNPRMETKNTSVHVRHVKEDTSWHLMPGKKDHTTSLCKQILASLNIAYL